MKKKSIENVFNYYVVQYIMLQNNTIFKYK